MAINPTSITGAAVSGLTSPGYTLTAIQAPAINGKSWAVTALTGTQTGVTSHTPSDPFTVSVYWPISYKTLGSGDAQNSVIKRVPRNRIRVIFRKGVTINTVNPKEITLADMTIGIPAGADSVDQPNLNALFSAIGGFFSAQADGLAVLAKTGLA